MIASVTSKLCTRPGCTRFAKEQSQCLMHLRQGSQPTTESVRMTVHTRRRIRLPTLNSTTPSPTNVRSFRCRCTGCLSYARNGGFCSRHGGGRKCRITNCNTPAQTGGLCRVHGGGTRCKVTECIRFARLRGYCSAHFRTEVEQTN